MDEINITGKALLYLAARLGASEIWGIADAFQGESDEDIEQDFRLIQDDLINKCYADMNFDGEFQANEEILDMVRICVDFDRYISAEIRECDTVKNNRLFFMKGNSIVKVQASDDDLLLSAIAVSDIPNEIMALYPEPVFLPCDCNPLAITMRELANIKKGRKSREKLIQRGCCENISAALSAGLSEESILNTMVVLDRKSGDIKLRSYSLVYSDKGTLLISMSDDNTNDDLLVESVGKNTWKEQLNKIIKFDDSEVG